jgi:ribonuclease BN (tRNA processing enzyme)
MQKLTFQAVILGSGTIVPSLEKSACSVLLKIGQTRLVLDTGPGTIRRLLETDTTIFDISHICYSHFHPDHISEIVPFLFGTKYPDAGLQKHPLTLFGGKGFIKFYNGLKAVFGDWMTPESNWLQLHDLSEDNYTDHQFNNFKLQVAAMNHHPESLAYRIQLNDGRNVVYSGDTDYCENLVSLSRQTDLLICECSMPDNLKVSGHLTPKLAGTIANKAQAKKLILTHLYPPCDQVDLIAQASQTYKGPIIIAKDLMTIEI